MTPTVNNQEISAVRDHFLNSGTFANMNFQFVKRADGAMFRYDLNNGTYKFYNNEGALYRAVVRFQKRGF